MDVTTPIMHKLLHIAFFLLWASPIQALEIPPGHQGLELTCETCHTTNAWLPLLSPILYDHSQTGFVLDAQHRAAECVECHSKGEFRSVDTACGSCHQDVHHGENGLECERCHDARSWNPAQAILLHDQTRFPLLGSHAVAECESCHPNQQRGQYTDVSTECVACHLREFEDTRSPNHITAGFGAECLVCHSMQAFKPATFDHSRTSFDLSGAHLLADCSGCHANGVFTGTPQDCWSCHKVDYVGARTPNHTAAGLSQECATCHSDVSWQPSTFDHGTTSFALTGAHVSADCAGCHANGVFADTPADCWSCHRTDYEEVQDPNHVTAAFPQDCTPCHTGAGWKPSTFDHGTTSFALTGAHVSADCAGCHVNGVFADTPADCWSCHRTDYEDVQDPNHVTAAFSQDCTPCHTDGGWEPSTFDHGTTSFALTGAHVSTDCAGCHVNGVFADTPADCWSCHRTDYEEVQDPNHVTAAFSQDCTPCHTDGGWEPSTFDHGTTSFALTGAHVSADCAGCHVNGVFADTPADCWSCHQSEYEDSRNPNHVTAVFSQDCSECHGSSGWSPATFDHGKTQFPLTGKHVSVECVDCHVGGEYAQTSTECYVCHQTDFESVRDPNHVRSQFPTDCSPCHTTSRWEPSTFDHLAYFPIYSGEHQGEWQSCADCHTQPENYAVFTCVSCHEHNRSEMDSEHNGVSGYVYVSQECLRCHPTGEESEGGGDD
jgi:nitrate/TMAO reductase-like tetraheme cytochrome c subunit